MALTLKRRTFCEEYVRDFNASKAAQRAGYSQRTSRAAGSFLLTIPYIREEINRLISERSMPAEEVLLRLAEQAREDMGDFLDVSRMGFQLDLDTAKQKGLTKLIRKLKQHTTTIVHKDGEEEEHTTIEIELYDAQAALIAIGKKHALFTDRAESLNVDLSTLTDEQLDLLDAGKSLPNVLKHSST